MWLDRHCAGGSCEAARNTIVFAGYQAGGTRGARLLSGKRNIRIHGEDVIIDAEVLSLPGMSAHADAGPP